MLPLTPPGSDLLMPDLPENSQVCPSIAMHAPDPSSPNTRRDTHDQRWVAWPPGRMPCAAILTAQLRVQAACAQLLAWKELTSQRSTVLVLMVHAGAGRLLAAASVQPVSQWRAQLATTHQQCCSACSHHCSAARHLLAEVIPPRNS